MSQCALKCRSELLTGDRADKVDECVSVHWISEESNRALFQIERFGILGWLPGNNDNRHCAPDAFHMLQKTESAHLAHFDICNDAAASGQSITPKKLFGRRIAFCLKAAGSKKIDE